MPPVRVADTAEFFNCSGWYKLLSGLNRARTVFGSG